MVFHKIILISPDMVPQLLSEPSFALVCHLLHVKGGREGPHVGLLRLGSLLVRHRNLQGLGRAITVSPHL